MPCCAYQDSYTGGEDSKSRLGTISPVPTICRGSMVRGPVYLLSTEAALVQRSNMPKGTGKVKHTAGHQYTTKREQTKQ